MSSALRHADLPTLTREMTTLLATARQEFGTLSDEQWNWTRSRPW